MGAYAYAGSELAVFEKATNWKAYWREHIERYVRGHVLEVGAGIGANTQLLASLPFRSWTCLEPDPRLASEIVLPSERHSVLGGTTRDCSNSPGYDAILYIDVLEHIEEDGVEMRRAADLLAPGGALIVLAPAHPFLYTPFDRAIGHFRRYTRGSLLATAPEELHLRKLIYLDSAGMLASLGNRAILQSRMPTEQQIRAWDRFLVPASRALDYLFGGAVGKSILGIWTRS